MNKGKSDTEGAKDEDGAYKEEKGLFEVQKVNMKDKKKVQVGHT